MNKAFKVGQRVHVLSTMGMLIWRKPFSAGTIKRLGKRRAAVLPDDVRDRYVWDHLPRWPGFRRWWKSRGTLHSVSYLDMVPEAEGEEAQVAHAEAVRI
jgi:hypothetical protein